MPPNPACRSLTRQGFKFGLSDCVTQPEQPEHSCRWQLWNGPLRRNHLGQKHVLYALVDPVSAPPMRPAREGRAALVEPPGTAPGSERFITTPVYRHSRPCGWHGQYRGEGVKKKGRSAARGRFAHRRVFRPGNFPFMPGPCSERCALLPEGSRPDRTSGSPDVDRIRAPES